jgi:hypothetical protein
LADFHASHNRVLNFTWQLPFGAGSEGAPRLILHGRELAGIWNVRGGSPRTVFVNGNPRGAGFALTRLGEAGRIQFRAARFFLRVPGAVRELINPRLSGAA